MPTEPTVLLRLDGVLHDSDLPVQSFARHLTELLPPELVRPMIAGMRGFLEDRPELIPAGIDLGPAEDGYQAVELLALAAGLAPAQISAARQASRLDLAGSAWAVDTPDGLPDLLADLRTSCVLRVFTEPAGPAGLADPAGPAVLDAIDIAPVELLPAPLAAALAGLLDGGHRPDRILIVGTRWTGELDAAASAGCSTALLDRYRLGRGAPDWRAADLGGLAGPIRSWAAGRVAADSAADAHADSGT